MPQIPTLYTFPAGTPVDPDELNNNFDAVRTAFNGSAILSDDTGAQSIAGSLEAEFIDRGGVVFDVRAFGAVLDGVTDDTASLTAAITAAQAVGGCVFIPDGTLLHDSVSVTSGVKLMGRSPLTSTLLWSGTGSPRPVTFSEFLEVDSLAVDDGGNRGTRGNLDAYFYHSDSTLEYFLLRNVNARVCTGLVNLNHTGATSNQPRHARILIEEFQVTWSKTPEEYGFGINIYGYPGAEVRGGVFRGGSWGSAVRIYQAFDENGVQPEADDVGCCVVERCRFLDSSRFDEGECVAIYCRGGGYRISDNLAWEWGGRVIDVQGANNASQLSTQNMVVHNRVRYAPTDTILATINIGAIIDLRQADGLVAWNDIDFGGDTTKRTSGIVCKWGSRNLEVRGNKVRNSPGYCIEVRGDHPTGAVAENVLIQKNELHCVVSSRACVLLLAGENGIAGCRVVENELTGTGAPIIAGISCGGSAGRITGLTVLRNHNTCSVAHTWYTFPYFDEVDDIGNATFFVDAAGDSDRSAPTLADGLLRLPQVIHPLAQRRGLQPLLRTLTLAVRDGIYSALAVRWCDWGADVVIRPDTEATPTMNGAIVLENRGTGLTTIQDFTGSAALDVTDGVSNNFYVLRLQRGRFKVSGTQIDAYRVGVRAQDGATVFLDNVTIDNASSGQAAVEADGQSRVCCQAVAGTGASGALTFRAVDGSVIRYNGSTLTGSGGAVAENGSEITGA